MLISLISHVENTIKNRRHKWIISVVLHIGYLISYFPFLSHLRSISLRGIAYYISCYQDGYRLLFTPILPGGIKPIIRFFVLRSQGDTDKAISAINIFTDDTYALKLLAVQLLHDIYKEKQDYESASNVLINFINSEPEPILINLAIAAAASAEVIHRDDIFADAASRIIDDIDRVLASPSLFKAYCDDAINGAISTFDLDLAASIAQRKNDIGLRGRNALSEIATLQEDLEPIAHVVRAARKDLLARCGRSKPILSIADAIVVFPAAALRTNIIDYPGFRADIRFCIKSIIETLNENRITFSVISRIRTHGCVDFIQPYFSYHTISNSPLGLHFKETDRRSLFCFDNHGYSGWSSFSSMSNIDLHLDNVDQAAADLFFRIDRKNMLTSRSTKYSQLNISELLPSRFILIGLQVAGDAVQSLSYATPFAMMDEVRATAKRLGITVVVKRHPECRSIEVYNYLTKHANDLTVVKGNIHDIIPKALAVCVVNSGVGAEALIYEKPVYVFGRSDYMGACFVCEKPGDFDRQFVESKCRLDAETFRRFWYYYRNIYACDLRAPEQAKAWISARVKQHLATCSTSHDQASRPTTGSSKALTASSAPSA